MLSVYIYCRSEYDADLMTDLMRETLIRLGGEQMNLEIHWAKGSRKDEQTGPVDLMIYEVSEDREFEEMIRVRKKCMSAELMVLGGEYMSPGAYIRPDICPSCLIGRPYVATILLNQFEKLIRKIYMRRERENPDLGLAVHYGAEWFRIPFSSITHLEARNKLICVHHRHGTVSFRDTLKHLEEILPDYFLRSSRGAIVNFLHVRSINIQTGNIKMMDSTIIPMSRKFRRQMEKKLRSCLNRGKFVDPPLN